MEELEECQTLDWISMNSKEADGGREGERGRERERRGWRNLEREGREWRKEEERHIRQWKELFR